ncbi:MAG: segregation/condensation protein A [Clostridium lundense]|nr:segregation/condensation protein A [Clostridium lundense]
MALNIKISNFEGPFDLLLHLIKKNEMEIYNVRISDITTHYLEYISKMKEMDLEITSEFIVIAATLLEIKSKELLPKEKKDETAMDLEEDTEKILINKLIEYKKFKAASEFFKNRVERMGVMFSKKPEIIEIKEKKQENILNNITMLELYNLYIEIMRIYNSKINLNFIPREIHVDSYKIEDKMMYISELMHKNKKAVFSSLAESCNEKIEVVVTFLALLELIKLRRLKIVQEDNFKEIYLERVDEDE